MAIRGCQSRVLYAEIGGTPVALDGVYGETASLQESLHRRFGTLGLAHERLATGEAGVEADVLRRARDREQAHFVDDAGEIVVVRAVHADAQTVGLIGRKRGGIGRRSDLRAVVVEPRVLLIVGAGDVLPDADLHGVALALRGRPGGEAGEHAGVVDEQAVLTVLVEQA